MRQKAPRSFWKFIAAARMALIAFPAVPFIHEDPYLIFNLPGAALALSETLLVIGNPCAEPLGTPPAASCTGHNVALRPDFHAVPVDGF